MLRSRASITKSGLLIQHKRTAAYRRKLKFKEKFTLDKVPFLSILFP